MSVVLCWPSDEHYPDVVAAGSLAAAVSDALLQAGSPLRASEPSVAVPTAYARVARGVRFSQISLARDVRLFLVDFWADRVYLAKHSSASLPDVAGVLSSWLTDELQPSDFIARHPSVHLTDRALSYERGTLIPDAWKRLLQRPLDKGVYGDLYHFIAVASEHPALRVLLPYMSLWRFSVCRGQTPRPGDYPCVEAAGPGRFAVVDYRGRPVYAEGDANEAVKLLVAMIAERDRTGEE